MIYLARTSATAHQGPANNPIPLNVEPMTHVTSHSLETKEAFAFHKQLIKPQ